MLLCGILCFFYALGAAEQNTNPEENLAAIIAGATSENPTEAQLRAARTFLASQQGSLTFTQDQIRAIHSRGYTVWCDHQQHAVPIILGALLTIPYACAMTAAYSYNYPSPLHILLGYGCAILPAIRFFEATADRLERSWHPAANLQLEILMALRNRIPPPPNNQQNIPGARRRFPWSTHSPHSAG